MAHTATGRRIRKRRLKADINVVPYIDVMLVLLIIFMVTAPLLNLGVDVKLPAVNAATIEQPKDPVVVQIDQDGRLAIILSDAPKKSLDRGELINEVRAYKANNPDVAVMVAGHGDVKYQAVLDLLQQLRTEGGVEKATLLTAPAEAAKR